MWPQFLQISRSLERIAIGANLPPTMQKGQHSSFFRFIVEGAHLPSSGPSLILGGQVIDCKSRGETHQVRSRIAVELPQLNRANGEA
jgi:hypothetical protein